MADEKPAPPETPAPKPEEQAQPAPESTAPAPAEPGLAEKPRPTETTAAPPPAESKILEPQKEQRANRAENQDYMRVLHMFSGGMIPQVYVEHITVAQDMVMGVGQSASTSVTPPNRDSAEVSPNEIRLIRQVYQPHAAYPTALKALRETRCVVLRGKPQVGKRAAAIRLALEVRVGDAPIWELSPEEDLADQIQPAKLKPGAIYVVDGLLRDRGQSLKPINARALLTTLTTAGCYLIVCVKPDVPLPPDLRTAVLDRPAVSTANLLEAHLDFYGPFDHEQAEAVLANERVKEILEKGLPPFQVDQLARQIADALRGDIPLENALWGFTAAAEIAVQDWFDKTADDVEESAFRVALAVFNGARYIAVNEAARALARALQPEKDGDAGDKDKGKEESPPASPFKKKKSDKLANARAKLVPRRVATSYSDQTTIEVVELEDPGYPAALLKYLWTEFDDLRRPLLDWLCAYAVQGSSDMRLRAAGALGLLATLDFDYLQARVFRPWAFTNAEDPDDRRAHYQALGNALGVLIWNDARADDVLGLLRDWVDDGNEALRWAAARAYAQVGLRYPREAIHQWRRILESKGKLLIRITESFGIAIPHPLHMSVVDAIITLFLRAVELPHRLRPVYEQALEGLATWIEADAKDRSAEQVGLPLFLALTPIRLPPEDGSGDPEEWPPAMLYIVGTQPDSSYRRALAGMLRRALNHPDLSQTAVAVLRFWSECSESNKWLEETLTALLREMLDLPGVSERERGRLRMHLSRWVMHPKKSLNVASRLLAALNLSSTVTGGLEHAT